MDRIAVLIPVYNDQDGLERTLASLQQNGETADVIVVDDGSEPPVSPRPNTHLLRLPENMGITKALNHGLNAIMASGYDYVARLDAGDISLPGRFEAQAAFLDQNADHAVVGCHVLHVTEEGMPLFVNQPPSDHAHLSQYMRRRNGYDHPSVMIRVACLKETGIYNEIYSGSEDYELWRRLLRRGYKFANLPTVYLHKEVTPTQITARRFRSGPRLRVQLRYFEPLQLECWIGVARTSIALVTPRRFALWGAKIQYSIRRRAEAGSHSSCCL